MTWRWPLVSRARLDDAADHVQELKTRVAQLETEQKRLVNIIMRRHGVQPIFDEPGAPSTASVVPLPPEPKLAPLDREAMTPITEAIDGGARSARAVVTEVQNILARRHKVSTGEARPRISRTTPPPAQAAVAAELATVLETAGNGTH